MIRSWRYNSYFHHFRVVYFYLNKTNLDSLLIYNGKVFTFKLLNVKIILGISTQKRNTPYFLPAKSAGKSFSFFLFSRILKVLRNKINQKIKRYKCKSRFLKLYTNNLAYIIILLFFFPFSVFFT